MNDLRTAAQQALDDLKDLHKNHNITCAGTITALESALAQQAEPVGAVLVNRESREGVMFYSVDMIPDPTTLKDRFELVKVYTAPPQRKPLTEEEIIDATEHIDTSRNGYFIHIARAIERAHGIKE